MKIAIVNDHWGYDLKKYIIEKMDIIIDNKSINQKA